MKANLSQALLCFSLWSWFPWYLFFPFFLESFSKNHRVSANCLRAVFVLCAFLESPRLAPMGLAVCVLSAGLEGRAVGCCGSLFPDPKEVLL